MPGRAPEGDAAPAEQLEQDEQDHADDPGAAADGHPAAAGKPLRRPAAGVLDLRGVELAVVVKAHPGQPSRGALPPPGIPDRVAGQPSRGGARAKLPAR